MNKFIRITALLLSVFFIPPTVAGEIKTFKFESIGGTVTVTQDVPTYFLGNYESISPVMQPGRMQLKKGRDPVSFYRWDNESRAKLFTWGVIVKNGKIEKQRVVPPNAAYKPYDRMKLVIRYENEDQGLVVWGLYRAESGKYGTRIVAGRYVKKSGK